jgi:hypothetical protein
MGVVLIRSPAVQPFAWALAPTIVLRLFDGRGFNQVASRAAVRLGTCTHHRVLNVVVRVWVCDFRYRWKMTCSAKILLQCVTNLFDTVFKAFHGQKLASSASHKNLNQNLPLANVLLPLIAGLSPGHWHTYT